MRKATNFDREKELQNFIFSLNHVTYTIILLAFYLCSVLLKVTNTLDCTKPEKLILMTKHILTDKHCNFQLSCLPN